MNVRSSLLFFSILILNTWSYAQSQTSKDSSVDVTPHWEKGETHAVKIKSTTTDGNTGRAQTYLSTFDAKFKVAEKDETGYTIEWIYTNSKLAKDEPVIENQMLSKLLNTKMVIRLSEPGRFLELVNVDEIKNAANIAVDELITNSAANPTMNTQFKAARQLIASKQGLEVALLKQIKFYNFSFGFKYKLNYVQTNNIKFPNPLGGQPFDAVEKVHLAKLDNKNSICVIETNKIIDGKVLKSLVMDYIKRASKADPKTIEEEIGNANLEISENSMQQIEFSKGLVQKSWFKRVMNLGFQNRTTNLEIETVD